MTEYETKPEQGEDREPAAAGQEPAVRKPAALAPAMPLALCYLVLPVLLSLIRLAGKADPTVPLLRQISFLSEVPLPLVWCGLAIFGALWLTWTMARPRREKPSMGRRILHYFEVLLMLVTAFLLLGAVQNWAEPRAELIETSLEWIAETAPLVYFLFAGLWCLSFGVPTRKAIHVCGSLLALLVVPDAILTYLSSGDILPQSGTLLLIDREVLACLLALSLFAGMDDENDAPEGTGLRPMRFSDVLLIFALVGTFSRTALFATACVWFFLGRGSGWLRLPFALVMLGAAALSLLTALPLTADTVQLDGHLLWMSGMEYFMDLPEILLYVHGPALFSLAMPVKLAANLGLPAKSQLFYPDQIHSMWLRGALVWGLYGPGLILLMTALPAMVRPTRLASGLVALLLTQGTIFGLMYDAEVAVALWLALITAIASWKPKNVRQEDAEDPWFAAEDKQD